MTANRWKPIYRIYGEGHLEVTIWGRIRVECSLPERSVHAGTRGGGTRASCGVCLSAIGSRCMRRPLGRMRGGSHQHQPAATSTASSFEHMLLSVAAVSSDQHAKASINMPTGRTAEAASQPWPCMPTVGPRCCGKGRQASSAGRLSCRQAVDPPVFTPPQGAILAQLHARDRSAQPSS